MFEGALVIDGDRITQIIEGKNTPRGNYERSLDASGCFVLPGVIDEHVHFREPGLTQKADIKSESRAAAYGGVTSYFEMPNTQPQTTTLETLNDKFSIAKVKSHVNYSFFLGATDGNAGLFSEVDRHRIPGIKLFMGSSTGNMLVDKRASLEAIFAKCADTDLPLMTHCEDTAIINRNMAEAKAKYGDDPDICHHPAIRSEEACWASTSLAVELARKHGTRLHVAHLTTAKELSLFGDNGRITAEVTTAHLVFADKDYQEKGALIKCNPAVKSIADREALRKALTNGRIYAIGTDHAPHRLSEKQGGCARASSGMPMVQFSLPSMLELVDNGVLTMAKMVELMSHNPAKLFSVRDRGYIRKDYKADIAIVRPHTPWRVTEDVIQSKCKWSPLTRHLFNWKVAYTLCNGHLIYDNGYFDDDYHGEEIIFR